MRINLGGADVGVAQDCLHTTEVCAVTEEVRSKHMSHHMRSYFFRNSGLNGMLFYDSLY